MGRPEVTRTHADTWMGSPLSQQRHAGPPAMNHEAGHKGDPPPPPTHTHSSLLRSSLFPAGGGEVDRSIVSKSNRERGGYLPFGAIDLSFTCTYVKCQ